MFIHYAAVLLNGKGKKYFYLTGRESVSAFVFER